MISNAKDRPLNKNPGTLPDLGGAFMDYMMRTTFTIVTKTVINHQLVEQTIELDALAMIQPLSAQQLTIKPEGQRSWKWKQIHALPSLVLKVDDKISFDGDQYRVLAKWDYKEYGFVEYHIVQDYRS